MKKLLIVTLIAALLLPVFAMASENDVVGCWSGYEMLETGAPTITTFYLAQDHTCYFVIQSFRQTEAGLGRNYVGTWEINSDGTVSVKTGNNSSMTLLFSDTYVGAMDKETGSLYVNVSKFY